MKALLSGVLCAGLLGQAPVYASNEDDDALPGIGHASVGWQQDDADGESTAIALSLPLTPQWYLNGSHAKADNQLDSTDGSDTVSATSTRFGISLERDGWGGSLSQLDYDDDAVLATSELQLMLRHRGERVELALELSQREHEVTVELPLRTVTETFDSRGVGLHLSVRTDNSWRVFAGWQHYTYDDNRVLDPNFGNRLLDYPNLYSQLMAQRDQADGALVDHNGWLGLDVPLKDHVLTFEHAVSELEIDGTGFSTDTIILALNLSEHWGLDLSAGISRGDDTDNIRFAGITAHLFW